jgi:predicted ArsR family transcriptional regulator
MNLLMELLGTEGFMARWNKTGETISLTEDSCPYLAIGHRHPEVCAIDQTVIEQVLDASVEKTTCVLNGADRCVFVITPGRRATISVDSLLAGS